MRAAVPTHIAAIPSDNPEDAVIDKDLLKILACPETHQPLREAETELVAELNAAISAGKVKSVGGEAVSEPLEGGLVREDEGRIYAIRAGIPVLLVDEGIDLPL